MMPLLAEFRFLNRWNNHKPGIPGIVNPGIGASSLCISSFGTSPNWFWQRIIKAALKLWSSGIHLPSLCAPLKCLNHEWKHCHLDPQAHLTVLQRATVTSSKCCSAQLVLLLVFHLSFAFLENPVVWKMIHFYPMGPINKFIDNYSEIMSCL